MNRTRDLSNGQALGFRRQRPPRKSYSAYLNTEERWISIYKAANVIAPTVHTQMLIRRPIGDVFNAFIDPTITTRFWFTKSSGSLEPGARVTWEWEMYGASAHVHVKAIEQHSRILVEWDDPSTTVEWQFTSTNANATLVQISNTGFQGTEEHVVAMAIDSMGGFSFVLAGLKAWLEHGIALDLVADRDPDAHVAR